MTSTDFDPDACPAFEPGGDDRDDGPWRVSAFAAAPGPERYDRNGPPRTSLSHPLRIDEIVAGDAGGRIGLSLCPGKQGQSVLGPRWARDLALDLDVIQRWRPAAVVTLIEDHEFAELGVPQLGASVRAHGIAWHHLPIADVQPPGAAFEALWRDSGPALRERLRAGARVLLHCRGGLGRAGTVAARLLVELGLTPQQAILRVRDARPGAIETAAQLQHVLRLTRR